MRIGLIWQMEKPSFGTSLKGTGVDIWHRLAIKLVSLTLLARTLLPPSFGTGPLANSRRHRYTHDRVSRLMQSRSFQVQVNHFDMPDMLATLVGQRPGRPIH